MSANERFKASYRRALDVALSASLGIHLLVFALLPRVEVSAESPSDDPLQVIELWTQPIEEPPPEVERPKRDIEEIADEEVIEEDEFDDSTFDPTSEAPAPPAPRSRGPWRAYDEAPRPLTVVHPKYPAGAREAGLEGRVLLSVSIDGRGRVLGVEVISGSELFRASAIEAVRQWRFEPARMSGVPVAVTVHVPIVFSLAR